MHGLLGYLVVVSWENNLAAAICLLEAHPLLVVLAFTIETFYTKCRALSIVMSSPALVTATTALSSLPSTLALKLSLRTSMTSEWGLGMLQVAFIRGLINFGSFYFLGHFNQFVIGQVFSLTVLNCLFYLIMFSYMIQKVYSPCILLLSRELAIGHQGPDVQV